MTSRALEKICTKAGWKKARHRGSSHMVFTKDGASRPIIIPANKKDLGDHVVRNAKRQIEEMADPEDDE